MEDVAYQLYLDIVKDYLVEHKVRLLTEKEEEIIVAHLKVAALTFCNERSIKKNDADTYNGLGITQVLSIETAKRASELHPDFPTPTEEQVNQRVEDVLRIQNYLRWE